MAMRFATPRLVRLNGRAVTDHNRSPLAITTERIETRKRMANGTLRTYWIADKQSWSMSWTMLPNVDAATVDGYMGADALEDLYMATHGDLTLELTYANAPVETKRVFFKDFSKTLLKRGKYDFYDVSVSFEEV